MHLSGLSYVPWKHCTHPIDRLSILAVVTHVPWYSVIRQLSLPRAVVSCVRRYLEPTTSVATKGGTGRTLYREATNETPVDGVSVVVNLMLGRRSLVFQKVWQPGSMGAECKDTRRVSGRSLPAAPP